jgi:hypothetical protein
MISKKWEPYISKRKKVFYKVFCLEYPNSHYLLSPILRYPYGFIKFPHTITNDQELDKSRCVNYFGENVIIIGKGIFHAYRSYFRAKHALENLGYDKERLIIVKGYIPAGTPYYKGDDGDIGANTMVLEKQIKNFWDLIWNG